MKNISKKVVILSILMITFIAANVVSAGKAKSEKPMYLGKWMRQATYTNGQLMHKEPATLSLMKDSFTSVNKYCQVAGSLKVKGNLATMTTTSTNCHGHYPGTVTIYTQTFSPDGNEMTIENTQFGAAVKETYKRIE